MTDKPRIAVDFWSDVMCPWCAVGYTQFAKAVKELEEEIDVEVRWMPFELNPDLSPEGKLQDRHLAEVYGRSPEEIAAMRAQMQATAERAGFAMTYSGEGEAPPAMMWNTFEAHFQQRRNVSDREVLLDIAESVGLDCAKAAEALADEALAVAVRAEEQRGRQAGINSVPSFVAAGKYLVQGAREPADYANILRQVAGLVRNA